MKSEAFKKIPTYYICSLIVKFFTTHSTNTRKYNKGQKLGPMTTRWPTHLKILFNKTLNAYIKCILTTVLREFIKKRKHKETNLELIWVDGFHLL